MSTETNTQTPAGAPVAWFEIGTEDPETARSFYGDMFGWTFAVEGPYSMITTGPDHPLQGGIQDTAVPLPDGTPRTYAVPYVEVPDVAAACGRVEDLGGKVMVPATTQPTGLVYAHVTDPFGNHIGLFRLPA
jgi:predicted enzyme related to lactoylglutathione lyase